MTRARLFTLIFSAMTFVSLVIVPIASARYYWG
jgi:hypothetical protein